MPNVAPATTCAKAKRCQQPMVVGSTPRCWHTARLAQLSGAEVHKESCFILSTTAGHHRPWACCLWTPQLLMSIGSRACLFA